MTLKCVDCWHHRRELDMSICYAPQRDLYVGTGNDRICQAARMDGLGDCGPKAKWFEAKPPRQPRMPQPATVWQRFCEWLASK